jgi:hypothetical protein
LIDTAEDIRRLRTKPRLKLFEPTSMAGPAGTVRAHLLDLSATGALVHAAEPPTAGGTVRLYVGGAARAATVMWVEGRRFGVRFRLALSDAEVAAALAAERLSA